MSNPNMVPSFGQAQTVSPYPGPPEFAQNYTNDLIRIGQAMKPPKVPTRFNVFNEEYNLEGNKRLGGKELTEQEYKCRNDALLKHLSLLQLSTGDQQEYTEAFDDADLAEREVEPDAEPEEEEQSSGADNDFIEDEASSNSSEEPAEPDSPVFDAAVEYMDDDDDEDDEDEEEDDDEDDFLEVGEEQPAADPPDRNGAAPDSPDTANEDVEPPSEFVDEVVEPAAAEPGPNSAVQPPPLAAADPAGAEPDFPMGEELDEPGPADEPGPDSPEPSPRPPEDAHNPAL